MKAVTGVVGLTATLAMGASTVGSRRTRRNSLRPRSGWPSISCRSTSASSVMTAGPVTGLTANDFTLDVDGRPRRIVSAQYVSSIRENAARPRHLSRRSAPTRRAAGG